MTAPPRLRVLIADDYGPMVAALERLVSLDCDVVGRLADGMSLLAETKRLQPDVLLLDLNLPSIDSLWACQEIRRTTPSTKVIVLTGGLDPNLRPQVLAAGASAFIEKSAAPRELLAAIAQTPPWHPTAE
jgi:two-component system, NarL family, invasion response regulator UvrY